MILCRDRAESFDFALIFSPDDFLESPLKHEIVALSLKGGLLHARRLRRKAGVCLRGVLFNETNREGNSVPRAFVRLNAGKDVEDENHYDPWEVEDKTNAESNEDDEKHRNRDDESGDHEVNRFLAVMVDVAGGVLFNEPEDERTDKSGEKTQEVDEHGHGALFFVGRVGGVGIVGVGDDLVREPGRWLLLLKGWWGGVVVHEGEIREREGVRASLLFRGWFSCFYRRFARIRGRFDWVA